MGGSLEKTAHQRRNRAGTGFARHSPEGQCAKTWVPSTGAPQPRSTRLTGTAQVAEADGFAASLGLDEIGSRQRLRP